MSNDVSKIYQFLSNQSNWVTNSDKNNDGVITQAEFRKFLSTNIDNITTDEIDAFFRQYDTEVKGKYNKQLYNASLLDKNEIKKLNTKVEIYNKVDEFLKTLSTANCGVRNAADWLKSVKESLSNIAEGLIDKGLSEEEVITELKNALPEVKAKTTANIYAHEYLENSSIKSQLPKGYKGDEDLEGLITSFVLTLAQDEEFNSKSTDAEKTAYIKSQAEKIINAYIATISDSITDKQKDLLADHGLSTDYFNGLQKAQVTNIMRYKITEFLNKNEYDKFKANIDLYNVAIDAFIEKMIAQNDYQTLKNFDITLFTKSEDYLNIDETLKNAELLKKREETIKTLDGYKSNAEKFAMVVEVFGEDYADKVNNSTSEEIDAMMAELNAKLATIIDPSTIKGKLGNEVWGNLSDKTVNVGSTATAQLSQSIVYNNQYLDSGKITYGCSANSAGVSVDANSGKVTISPTIAGTYYTEIYIKYDGQIVATKKIQVIAEDMTPIAQSNATFRGSSIVDILRDKTGAQEITGFYEGKHFRQNAKSGINNMIQELKNSLIAAGYDATRCEKAAVTLQNYYYAAIDAIDYNKDPGDGKRSDGYISTSFSYQDANGNTYTENSSYYKDVKKKEKNVNAKGYAQSISQDSTGLSYGESFKGTDEYNCWINTSVLINKFIKFFDAM